MPHEAGTRGGRFRAETYLGGLAEMKSAALREAWLGHFAPWVAGVRDDSRERRDERIPANGRAAGLRDQAHTLRFSQLVPPRVSRTGIAFRRARSQ